MIISKAPRLRSCRPLNKINVGFNESNCCWQTVSFVVESSPSPSCCIASFLPGLQQQQQQQQIRWFAARDEDEGAVKKIKVKKKPKKADSVDDAQGAKQLQMIIAAIDAPKMKEPPISEEEKQRRYTIGRNHVIGCFKQHNEVDHDLTCKIKMKRHAIKMLPRNSTVKEEALKESDVMPPPWRHIPVWTPPIPGFDPSKYIGREEDD